MPRPDHPTDGRAIVGAEATVSGTIDSTRVLLTITTSPVHPRADHLVGTSPGPGFRRQLDEEFSDLVAIRSPLHNLLDALPGWARMQGFATMGTDRAPRPPLPVGQRLPQIDICSGWRDGGTLARLVTAGGSGAAFSRPLAPRLESRNDPMAWHETGMLPASSMRRRRRLDVVAGDRVEIDAMFRDSFMDDSDVETVLHEYGVRASVDPGTWEVVMIEATPHVLPYMECPWAADSAQGLVGRRLGDLSSLVRTELQGTSTCTHLNELLRTFDDVGALVALVSD